MSKKTAYVLKVFPRVSETFVINEIRAQEDLGREVEIFSLHRNPHKVSHAILRGVRATPAYVDEALPDQEDVRIARKKLVKKLGLRDSDRDRFVPRKYVRLALGLARAAQDRGCEHFHAHFASRAGHVAVLAGMLADVPVSITGHAKDLFHETVDKDLLRWKIDRCEFFVTVTDYNLRYLRDLVGNTPGVAERIVRLYNGIDLDHFAPESRQPSAPPLIHAVGRLVEKKGFAYLLDACALLRDRGIDFRCAVQGDGDLAETLRNRCTELALEGVVRFEGAVASEEVARRLSQSTVATLPCVRGADGNVDALPTVLLEALATGVPVVSTRLSGVPEIVEHEVNGLLVEPGDASGLADALETLIADAATADEMGRSGRRRAEELFSLEANAVRLARWFDGELDGAG